MKDRKIIEARIAELRGELDHAEGTPTEVYSRIVGYYRSVRNWNAGKREEYGQRQTYAMPAMGERPSGVGPTMKSSIAAPSLFAEPALAPATARLPSMAVPSSMTALPAAASLRDGVLVFTREACPNCPPVANYVVTSGMRAVFVDVDRDEGLALARDMGVLATPTVLALDGEGHESFRAFDLASLRNKLAEGLKSRMEANC